MVIDLTKKERWKRQAPLFGWATMVYTKTLDHGEEFGESYLAMFVPNEMHAPVVNLVNRWLTENKNEGNGDDPLQTG